MSTFTARFNRCAIVLFSILVDIGQAVDEEGTTGLVVKIFQQADQNEIAQKPEKPNREISYHRRRGKLPFWLLEKV
jgi:hypothetical protein